MGEKKKHIVSLWGFSTSFNTKGWMKTHSWCEMEVKFFLSHIHKELRKKQKNDILWAAMKEYNVSILIIIAYSNQRNMHGPKIPAL